MRTKLFILIPTFIILAFVVLACKKQDKETFLFNHRLTSETSYSNNILLGQTSVEYSGNNISKVIGTGYNNGVANYTSTYIITYPSNNSISITLTNIENNQTSTETQDVTLSNNRISESTNVNSNGKNKISFVYNSDGKVVKTSEYDYKTTWVLAAETNYTYNSGKLTEQSKNSANPTSNYQEKDIITYTGEEIKEVIHSNNQSGGALIEWGKDIYTYSGVAISKITGYSKNTGTLTWAASGMVTDFVYDSDGNLISQSRTDPYAGGIIYKDTYTYQDGSGNFLQILEALGGANNSMYPLPHKK